MWYFLAPISQKLIYIIPIIIIGFLIVLPTETLCESRVPLFIETIRVDTSPPIRGHYIILLNKPVDPYTFNKPWAIPWLKPGTRLDDGSLYAGWASHDENHFWYRFGMYTHPHVHRIFDMWNRRPRL